MAAEEGDGSGADASVSEQHGGAAALWLEEMAVAGGEGCHGNGRRNGLDKRQYLLQGFH